MAHDAVSCTTTQSGDDAGALVVNTSTAGTGFIPSHAIGLTNTHRKQPAVVVKHGDIQRAAQAAIPPRPTARLVHRYI